MTHVFFKNWAIGCQVLRVHQWLKNILLFVPLLAAHKLMDSYQWIVLCAAFFSFSFFASLAYVLNDLLDLEYDRQHPRKCQRPFASGQVPVWIGLVLIPFLLLVGVLIAYWVGLNFLSWLLLYFVLTCAYSWRLKQVVLVDCLILAMLYTLRIIAGATAVGLILSFWLLAFSVFLFLSLAFLKRYSELKSLLNSGRGENLGRNYRIEEASLIQTFGISSGYTAVLILSLYLNSDTILKLYRTPEFVWAAVPIFLFWISWMWMQAERGNIEGDPFVFAVKDKASLWAGFLFISVLMMGAADLGNLSFR